MVGLLDVGAFLHYEEINRGGSGARTEEAVWWKIDLFDWGYS